MCVDCLLFLCMYVTLRMSKFSIKHYLLTYLLFEITGRQFSSGNACGHVQVTECSIWSLSTAVVRCQWRQHGIGVDQIVVCCRWGDTWRLSWTVSVGKSLPLLHLSILPLARSCDPCCRWTSVSRYPWHVNLNVDLYSAWKSLMRSTIDRGVVI